MQTNEQHKINTDKKYCVFIIQIKTWVENNNNKYKTKTKKYILISLGWFWLKCSVFPNICQIAEVKLVINAYKYMATFVQMSHFVI